MKTLSSSEMTSVSGAGIDLGDVGTDLNKGINDFLIGHKDQIEETYNFAKSIDNKVQDSSLAGPIKDFSSNLTNGLYGLDFYVHAGDLLAGKWPTDHTGEGFF